MTLKDDHSAEVRRVLEPFGFTETEALVYAELVVRPDQTGYGISKAVKKGQPSIYAALAALERKGAVVVRDGDARRFSAIPAAELLDRMQYQFTARRTEAEKALGRLKAAPKVASVDHLVSAEQVYAKARALIRSAEETLLFVVFPQPLAVLRDDLATATEGENAPSAAGLLMRDVGPIGQAKLTVSPGGDRVLSLWPGQIVHIVADGRRALLAEIGEEGEAHAIATEDGFISTVLHNALTSDILIHGHREPGWVGPNLELFGRHPPGLRDLINRDWHLKA